MENHKEKKMEHDMETGMIQWSMGIRFLGFSKVRVPFGVRS